VIEGGQADVLERRLAAARRADPVDDAALASALEDALELARTDAEGSVFPPVAELAGDLADVYERLVGSMTRWRR